MRVTIKMVTDNATFESPNHRQEVPALLKAIAPRITEMMDEIRQDYDWWANDNSGGPMPTGQKSCPIRDTNGNTVGHATVEAF